MRRIVVLVTGTLLWAVGYLYATNRSLIAHVEAPPSSASDSVPLHAHAILPGLTVDAQSANPGDEGVGRSACVSFALGPSTHYQCGDLQIQHTLPTTRARNRNRTPVLLYNSATAKPMPIVAAYVSTPASTTADSIIASLAVSGTTVATSQFAGAAWGSGGVTRRVAVKFDGTSYATAIYPYTMTITAKISGQYYVTQDTGRLVIINRSASKYGAGWWLASHERLYSQSDGSLLWVGGDGSWLHFVGGSTTWISSGATSTDTITKGYCYDPNTQALTYACYERHLRNNGRVNYSQTTLQIVELRERGPSAGSMDFGQVSSAYTTNSNGVVTQISLPIPYYVADYDSPPSPPTPLAYTLAYGGTGSTLSQITSPGLTAAQNPMRQTYVTIDGSGRLTQIKDPDSLYTKFTYSGSTALVAGRVDKRSDTLTITLDSAQKVSQISRPLNATQVAVSTFCAAEVQGLASANCSTGPVDSALVATAIDGPRDSTDVLDKSKIWITRAGMARKIVGAVYDTTLITFGDSRFIGIPTIVRAPDGHTTQTWYSARALPDSAKDLSLCISGSCSTTRYAWDSKWNSVAKVIHPAGDSAKSSYDSGTGQLLWQQNGLGSAGQTTFAYDSVDRSLVTSVSPPASGRASVFHYEPAYNNLYSDQEGSGGTFTTWYFFNLAGGLTQLVKQEPRGNETYFGTNTEATTLSTFDLMDRVTWTGTYETGPLFPYNNYTAPTSHSTFKDSVSSHTTYDAEGNATSFVRRGVRVADSIMTRWTYDKANRKTTEVAPDGAVDSIFYDKAGNVTSTKNRRAQTLTMSYDAANRLVSTIVPAVTYDSVMRGIAALQPTGGDTANPAYPRYPNASGWKYAIRADTVALTYDAAGHVLTANNHDAWVTRTYTNSGQVASERQRIRTWNGAGADSDYAKHDYTLNYSYDIGGRRTAVQHPSTLLPRDSLRTIGNSTTFAYEGGTGRLSAVIDPFGQRHLLAYTPAGQVSTVRDSFQISGQVGTLVDSITYSATGFSLAQQAFNHLGSLGTQGLFSESYTRDIEGRLQMLSDTSSNAAISWYNALGQVSYVANGNLAVNIGCESHTYDGLGNLLTHAIVPTVDPDATTTNPSATCPNWAQTQYFYETGTGRMLRSKDSSSVKMQSYDAAGNLQFAYTDSLHTTTSYYAVSDRYTYYGADGAIRAADARSDSTKLSNTSAPYKKLATVFEEYRYDAFGRRVAVRARKHCAAGMGTLCQVGTIRRTVWDGSQELHEITMPGDDSVSAAGLENDTLLITRSFPHDTEPGSSPPAAFDALTLFGRVLYVNGLGVDQPMAIIRSNYVSVLPYSAAHVFRPVTLIPKFDVAGSLTAGVFIEGSGQDSYTEWDSGYARSIYTFSPALALRLHGPPTVPESFGTLLNGKRDAVGTIYLRNRSYDPITGRFTQEDPIGLDGGVNLYSYASGDPINRSDPSGLSDEENSDCPDGYTLTFRIEDDGTSTFYCGFVGGVQGMAPVTISADPAECDVICQAESLSRTLQAAGTTWSESGAPGTTDCSHFVFNALCHAGRGGHYVTSGDMSKSKCYVPDTSHPQGQRGDIVHLPGHMGFFTGDINSKGQIGIIDWGKRMPKGPTESYVSSAGATFYQYVC